MRPTPRTALMSSPAPCAALLLLVVNDHLLKGASLLPAPLTGKLSDLAGLFFFPILLRASLAIPPRIACIATGLAFAAIKLDPAANALAAAWWGVHVMDPTDLAALLMLPLAYRWMVTRAYPAQRPARRGLEYAAILTAALASVATSAPPPPLYDQPREYPMWSVVDPHHGLVVDCVRTRLWVAKSGKQGLGLGLTAESSCAAPASLSLQGSLALTEDTRMSKIDAMSLAAPVIALEPGQTQRVYLPVAFDNERAWDEGRRVALLSLRWVVSSADRSVDVNQTLLLRHARVADHRIRPLEPHPARRAP